MIRPMDLPNTITSSTPEYPYGQLKDDIVAGDGSGTPVRADWQQDMMYMPLILANRAGIAPNTLPETVTTNQINAVMDKHPFTNPVAATSVVGTDKIAVGTGGSSDTPKLATLDTITKYVTGRRNYFVNGCLRLWQSAATNVLNGTGVAVPLNTNRYDADQCLTTPNGTDGGCTVSRQEFVKGQTDVPGEPQYYIKLDVVGGTDAVNNFTLFRQYLEGVRTFAGQTVTLSFWAKADSGTPKIAIEYAQRFGGSDNLKFVQQVQLTTAWTKHTVTFTLDSIAGKTITGTDDRVEIRFWLSGGSNLNGNTGSLGLQTAVFNLALFQIEKGSVATDFEWLNMAEVVQQCQRFYEKSYSLDTPPGTITTEGMWLNTGATSGGANVALQAVYKTRKRKIIQPTIYSPASSTPGTIQFSRSGVGNTTQAGGVVYHNDAGAGIASGNIGATWVAAEINAHWVADARY